MTRETPQVKDECRVNTVKLSPLMPDGTRERIEENEARQRYLRDHCERMQTWRDLQSQYMRPSK